MADPKVCEQCQEAFWPVTDHQHFCSRSCAARWRMRGKLKRRSLHARHCHDCGTPTTQYRCQPCWDKLRLAHGIPLDVEEDWWEPNR